MNKLFRPKCMRRMAVFMALVAPIVYLFGSLFFALNGAHGTQVFADSGTKVERVDYSFSRVYRVWYHDSGQIGYYDNCFSTSSVYPYPVSSVSFVVVADVDLTGLQIGVSFWNDDTFVSTLNRVDEQSSVSFTLPSGSNSFRVSFYSLSAIHLSDFNDFPVSIYSVDSTAADYYSAVGFSEYIFGQFFPKDNFLVKWGENAISENPYGFAPFGYFWRYLDTNVLHLSNEQVGLMAYGYMYYASHVLLFDVGFILVTFFLTFIQKVADKIGGEDHA